MQIMIHHPVLHHFLIARFGIAVVTVRVNADTTTRSEYAPDLNVFRRHQCDKVFHDDINTVFVERTVIPEAEQIQFHTFAFHHPFVGNITDVYGCEIGLRGDGTKTGKLRTIEPYPIVVARVRIVESLKDSRVVSKFVIGFFAKKSKRHFDKGKKLRL